MADTDIRKDDGFVISRSYVREQALEGVRAFFLPLTAVVTAYKKATRPKRPSPAAIRELRRAAIARSKRKRSRVKL